MRNEAELASPALPPSPPRLRMADESESIAALASALAKAQGAMKSAAKDAMNPHFGSKYADLAAIWDACRDPLSANGLAVMQRVRTSNEGVTVVTMLVHSSGEWVRDHCTFPVAQRTPQAFGSAITYARRYSLAALVGVAADEDDDGNQASAAAEQPRRQQRQRQAEAPAQRAPQQPAPAARAKEEAPPAAPPRPKLSPALAVRAKNLWVKAKSKGMDAIAFEAWVAEILGTNKPSNEFTEDDLSLLEVAAQEPPSPTEAASEDVPY